MNKLFLFVIASLILSDVSGQYTQTVTPVLDQQAGTMKELHPKPEGVKGSVYLNDDWISSDFYLKPGTFAVDTFENVPIKLDLKSNTLEINTKEGIKVLDGSKIQRFEWVNPQNNQKEEYTNCDAFMFEGTHLNGFCKISGEGVKLTQRHYVEILKADYNVSLDVGNKEDRIIKKMNFYLLRGNKIVEYDRKSLYETMSDKAKEIKKFIKDNNIKTSKEEGLERVVDYYNSLNK